MSQETHPQDDQPHRPPRPPQSTREMPAVNDKRRPNQLSGVQVMFAAILAIGMILGINFSSRIASSQPLRAYYNAVETEIAQLRQEQANLIVERDYVQSDSYVEHWARSEGKMVRPGEVLVIPRSVGGSPTPPPPLAVEFEVATPDTGPEIWHLWWALFFDSPPPQF